jgi:hypothetical protein
MRKGLAVFVAVAMAAGIVVLRRPATATAAAPAAHHPTLTRQRQAAGLLRNPPDRHRGPPTARPTRCPTGSARPTCAAPMA